MTNGRKATALLIGALAVILGLAVVPLPGSLDGAALAQAQRAQPVPEPGPTGGTVPGDSLGSASDAELWRAIRRGVQGNVSIPDRNAAVMIQSEGDNWRAWRNGPMTVYGGWIMLGVIGLVALYFVLRGRIRTESGPSGRTVERFNGLERFTHWLTAVSFVLLALTGLNMLYGRHSLLPLLGPEVFATLTQAGKYIHNYLAFAFMAGLVLMFVIWVRQNIPNRHDLIWLAKGGGFFVKGVHAPAKKFNAGQKIVFWLVILGGLSLSLSGVALLFPFQFAMFGKTFELINLFGFSLPTDFAPVQEMQLSQLWHAFVGIVMIAIILAHIYLGSLGMEGAFDAMGTGRVDENWAREHHNLWFAEIKGSSSGGHGAQTQPAE